MSLSKVETIRQLADLTERGEIRWSNSYFSSTWVTKHDGAEHRLFISTLGLRHLSIDTHNGPFGTFKIEESFFPVGRRTMAFNRLTRAINDQFRTKAGT